MVYVSRGFKHLQPCKTLRIWPSSLGRMPRHRPLATLDVLGWKCGCGSTWIHVCCGFGPCNVSQRSADPQIILIDTEVESSTGPVSNIFKWTPKAWESQEVNGKTTRFASLCTATPPPRLLRRGPPVGSASVEPSKGGLSWIGCAKRNTHNIPISRGPTQELVKQHAWCSSCPSLSLSGDPPR